MCYTCCMSTTHVTRVRLDEQHWIDLRTAALYIRLPVPVLLGRLVREYLHDPKRSPIVRRRQPARRGRIKA